MARFLVGKELNAEVRKLMAEPGIRCAVAFWGAGAEGLVTGGGARVVCNLRMGGTNPFALRKVKAEMRKRDDLHAKVYLGKDRAVVSSANVSANGLGLEGVEQAGWIEAGVLVEDVAPLSEWFDALWVDSQAIGKADWAAAEKAWSARTKPTLASFADFDLAAPDLPLVNWIAGGEWETCHDSIEKQFGATTEDLVRQVEDGIELEHPDDQGVLAGRWVLCWSRGRKGPPPASGRPWWLRLGHTVLKGGFRYQGEKLKRDVLLGAPVMPPVPFDPAEKRFVQALRELLSRKEYGPLVAETYQAPWFATRQELTRRLWRDLGQAYGRG